MNRRDWSVVCSLLELEEAMKITIEVPSVLACEVTQCAYNVNENCHARAITVGDGIHPACDTFYPAGAHTGGAGQVGGVGACKVSGCTYNQDLECSASGVRIGVHEAHADCMTYSPR